MGSGADKRVCGDLGATEVFDVDKEVANEAFRAGVKAYRDALVDSFRLISIRDKPGFEKKFTALDIIKLLKA